MPRHAGLSVSTRVSFMRRKPSDSTVALISGLAPMVLFIRVAFMVSATVLAHRLWALVGGGKLLAHHRLQVLAAQLGNLLGRLQLLQRPQGRSHRADPVV